MTSIIIFTLFSLLLVGVGIFASKQSKDNDGYFLANRSLGWLIVGISASVTGNTGFIVTGAVGVGYSMGMSSLLLPLSWLLGDLFYWNIFPKKLNHLSKLQKSSTISEYLSHDLKKRKPLLVVSTLLVGIIILFYTSAQWVAAGKIFSAFFNSSIILGILISAFLVIIYSSIGGLKSSVLTDIVQAIFVLILLVFIYFTIFVTLKFNLSTLKTIEGHQDLTYYYKLFPLLGFVLGWAFASVGFGLSQPQILIRYFATKESNDFNKAKWVYIIFLQLTWIGFTLFGVFLRIINPDIPADLQEQGLAIFIKNNYSLIIIGVLISGMFATISSTADSFLISLSNSIKNDVLSPLNFLKNINNRILTLFIGVVTILLAIRLKDSSVLTIAMNAVSYLGASIAPAVIIKTLNFKHNSMSLTWTIIIALVSSLIWQYLGFSSYVGDTFFETLNIATIGILVGLLFNYFYMRFQK